MVTRSTDVAERSGSKEIGLVVGALGGVALALSIVAGFAGGYLAQKQHAGTSAVQLEGRVSTLRGATAATAPVYDEATQPWSSADANDEWPAFQRAIHLPAQQGAGEATSEYLLVLGITSEMDTDGTTVVKRLVLDLNDYSVHTIGMGEP
jgi:hypothetical protein